MYLAGYIVDRLPGGRRVRGRPPARTLGPLRADRAGDPADASPRWPHRCRCWSATGPGATSPPPSRSSWPRSRAWPRPPAARPSTCSAGTPTARSSTGSRSRTLLSLLAFHSCERDGAGARHGARRPTARRSTSCASRSSSMVGIGTLLALLGVVFLVVRVRRRRLPRVAAGSTARWCSPGPPSLVALIAGWVTTEVGRQPWVVYGVMRTSQAVTGAGRHPGRLRDAGASSTSAWPSAWPGSCAASRARRSSVPTPIARPRSAGALDAHASLRRCR